MVPLPSPLPSPRDALPTMLQLEKSRAKLADCEGPTTDYFRAYFAVNLGTGTTVWRGREPGRDIQAWVSDTVCALKLSYWIGR